jgi:hypothetical protein
MGIQLLEPRRVRHPRGAYGWVELRFVTQGYLERVGRDAALVYLFLCAVGDRQGISFWSRAKMAQMLHLDSEAIEVSLNRLAASDLVAVKDRVVQVLPIPDSPDPTLAVQVVTQRPVGTGVTHEAGATGTAASATPEQEPPLSEDEVRACQGEARTQIARFAQRREPSPSAVQALARCLALKARKNIRTTGERLQTGTTNREGGVRMSVSDQQLIQPK